MTERGELTLEMLDLIEAQVKRTCPNDGFLLYLQTPIGDVTAYKLIAAARNWINSFEPGPVADFDNLGFTQSPAPQAEPGIMTIDDLGVSAKELRRLRGEALKAFDLPASPTPAPQAQEWDRAIEEAANIVDGFEHDPNRMMISHAIRALKRPKDVPAPPTSDTDEQFNSVVDLSDEEFERAFHILKPRDTDDHTQRDDLNEFMSILEEMPPTEALKKLMQPDTSDTDDHTQREEVMPNNPGNSIPRPDTAQPSEDSAKPLGADTSDIDGLVAELRHDGFRSIIPPDLICERAAAAIVALKADRDRQRKFYEEACNNLTVHRAKIVVLQNELDQLGMTTGALCFKDEAHAEIAALKADAQHAAEIVKGYHQSMFEAQAKLAALKMERDGLKTACAVHLKCEREAQAKIAALKAENERLSDTCAYEQERGAALIEAKAKLAALKDDLKARDAICDSYADENQKFYDKIDALKAENERLRAGLVKAEKLEATFCEHECMGDSYTLIAIRSALSSEGA